MQSWAGDALSGAAKTQGVRGILIRILSRILSVVVFLVPLNMIFGQFTTEFENAAKYDEILRNHLHQIQGRHFSVDSYTIKQTKLYSFVIANVQLNLKQANSEGLIYFYTWDLFIHFSDSSINDLKTIISNSRTALRRIQRFEENPSVATFLAQDEIDTLMINQSFEIEREDSLGQSITYDLAEEHLSKYYLNSRALFNKADTFYSDFSNNLPIQEFVSKYKLLGISYRDSMVSVQSKVGKLTRSLRYDLRRDEVHSFRISNTHGWGNLPELQTVYDYLDSHVFEGRKSDWSIPNKGFIHTTSSMWTSSNPPIVSKYRIDILMEFKDPNLHAVTKSGKSHLLNTAIVTVVDGKVEDVEMERSVEIVKKNP